MTSTDSRPRLSRRRLLATGGGLVAAGAVGAGGYALGRRGTAESGVATAGQIHQFVTRADLRVPVVSVTVSGTPTPGMTFLTPAAGAGGRGPLIVDDSGAPIWFRQVSGPAEVAVDLRVQTLAGEPVLTWWEGVIAPGLGVGAGEFVIADPAYREIARIRADGAVPADQHDFVVTDRGTALFFVYEPVSADLTAVGGVADGSLYDGVIQEIDIDSGETVLRWRARDHVALAESYAPAPSGEQGRTPYDFFHANSVAVDHDDHLLVSARHTWTIYKIDRSSGKVLWRLGGKNGDFTIAPGAEFSWQHDARRRADGTLGLFDNRAGITTEADQSRGLILAVDETARTAAPVRELLYPEPALAPTQGGVQELAGGASFVGWGQQPYFSEHAADGSVRLAGRLPADNGSYRAYRFAWNGRPTDQPAVAVSAGGGAAVTVHASWNGATEVASWQVRGGPQPDTLTVLGEADRTGFETAVTVSGPVAFIVADALDTSGRMLATSPVTPVPPAHTDQ
nr:arylsulfotransferase family protein [Micromonospora sp. DSM 115978]